MRNSKWFWGIFFICAAALIIVNQLGYFTPVNLLSLFFAILLVAVIIKSIPALNFPGILFPLALLAIIFNEPLGIESLTPWPLLITALLGSIGLSLIFNRNRYMFHIHHHGDKDDYNEHIGYIKEDVNSDVVDCRVSFGASSKYINSDNLQRVNISCSFGALKVFLDNAQLHPDGAEINLDCSFSGMELYIPRHWNIVNNTSSFLGSMDEKNRRGETTGPTLTLKGNIQFGGVEIIYV